MSRGLKGFSLNNTIKKRLTFSIITLIFAAMIVLTAVLNFVFYDSQKTRELENIQKSTSELKVSLELILAMVHGIADSIDIDPSLLLYSASTSEERAAFRQSKEKIDEQLHNLEISSNFILGLYVIGDSENIFSSSDTLQEIRLITEYELFILKDLRHDVFYSGIHSQSYQAYNNQSVISYTQPILNPNTDIPIGRIIVDIDYSYMKSLFKSFAKTSKEKILIIDNQRREFFSNSFDASDFQLLQNSDLFSTESNQIETQVNGENVVVIFDTVRYSDWKIIRVISLEALTASLISQMLLSLAVLVGFILVTIPMILRLSETFIRPILRLNSSVAQINRGQYDIQLPIERTDEIGQLTESFNSMTATLKRNIDQLIADEKTKSALQFEILQSQINPHFLYNTLDSIRWVALIHNNDVVADMTNALIRLLRYNISSSDQEEVSLSEEIESIQNYAFLQKYRFGDTFDIQYDIPKTIFQYQTLKFILQPFIENAILYATNPDNEKCSIVIKAREKNGKLFISVIDNGQGFDVTQPVNTVKKSTMHTGIGIHNVKKRITLYYGGNYGLKVLSSPNKGTKIIIKIPSIQN